MNRIDALWDVKRVTYPVRETAAENDGCIFRISHIYFLFDSTLYRSILMIMMCRVIL